MTQPFKGLAEGRQISAQEYNRIGRAVMGAYGTGAARVSMVNGRMQVHVDRASTSHPFKLTAEFDNDTSPTNCFVSIAYGTLQGTVASGSSYPGVPLFEGSGGSRLDADPAPVFDVGVTARTNYFYFEVTTDEYGLIDEVAIVHKVAADLPLTETPYVQPDVPDDGDPGTAGVYYWLIGTVTVSEVGLVWSIAYNQGVQTSMGFYTCGSGGRFYRA